MLTFNELPEPIKAMFPNAKVFEMVYGEVDKIYKCEANGKQYLIMDCTKSFVIDLPRPETVEEFDRYYYPALMSILNKMLQK